MYSDCFLIPLLDSLLQGHPKLTLLDARADVACTCVDPGGERREVEALLRRADEQRRPVIVELQPGRAAGEDLLRLAAEHPGARLILSHGCAADLPWIWEEAPRHPNLFFDTSCWNHSDTIALLTLLPPGQVLMASHPAYCTPLAAAIATIRCGLQVGLTERQLAGVAGRQMERLAQGMEPLDLGPPPAPPRSPFDPLLERAYGLLTAALAAMRRGQRPAELLEQSKAATCVSENHPCAETMEAVRCLLDLHEIEAEGPPAARGAPGWELLSVATALARTPAVPVPQISAERVAPALNQLAH